MAKETLFTDLNELDKFMKANNIHDKFTAVQVISRQSRLLQEAYTDLDEKEAISWVLRGHPTEAYKAKHRRLKLQRELNNRKFEMLSYIDDEDVKTSCEQSINASLKANHPIYQYTADLSDQDKARVRIITKLTLDQLKQQEQN